MADPEKSALATLLSRHEKDILEEWVQLQLSSEGHRPDLMTERDVREQSARLLAAIRAAAGGGTTDIRRPEWAEVRDLVGELSQSRARQGFAPVETASFVLSLKEPVFALLRRELEKDPAVVAQTTWATTLLFDRLGLLAMEMYQKGREEVIKRQQEELLELSTPVVRLWDNVVAVPLIGTLDSARTQVVMENLLQEIVNLGAGIAIIDITGVPTVDTLVAQHLLKAVAAARLMGADCIISGIRPQIAQTIVHLGVDLGDVTTKATLADAFALALKRQGLTVTRVSASPASGS
jgi:rsbT co-antagonist protein RsbR